MRIKRIASDSSRKFLTDKEEDFRNSNYIKKKQKKIKRENKKN